MEAKRTVKELSFPFALRIVKLHQQLTTEKKEYVLSRQLLRCGTSIGANIYEGLQGFTRRDFAYKMNIALKEANETEYWLNLLFAASYLKKDTYESMHADCRELRNKLSAIVKTMKNELIG